MEHCCNFSLLFIDVLCLCFSRCINGQSSLKLLTNRMRCSFLLEYFLFPYSCLIYICLYYLMLVYFIAVLIALGRDGSPILALPDTSSIVLSFLCHLQHACQFNFNPKTCIMGTYLKVLQVFWPSLISLTNRFQCAQFIGSQRYLITPPLLPEWNLQIVSRFIFFELPIPLCKRPYGPCAYLEAWTLGQVMPYVIHVDLITYGASSNLRMHEQ